MIHVLTSCFMATTETILAIFNPDNGYKKPQIYCASYFMGSSHIKLMPNVKELGFNPDSTANNNSTIT